MSDFPVFTLEMANNHGGSLEDGKKILDEFAWVARRFPGQVAFKFQYRELDTYVHPAYAERMDINYIARFHSTRLGPDEQLALKEHAVSCGFTTVCTPFDEASAELVAAHGYDFCKIASACLTDWPLLEAVVRFDLPVIASTGGSTLSDVARAVTFFENRDVPLALLHCVALYPTPPEHMRLGRVRELRDAFPGVPVGFSTHESPTDTATVQLAVAAGAELFEKHVGVALTGPPNAYSADPEQLAAWLDAYEHARAALEDAEPEVLEREEASLHQLRRGAWLRRDAAAGETIRARDLFFAMPTQPEQLTANSFGKYVTVELGEPLAAGEPLLASAVARVVDSREAVQAIASTVLEALRDAGVTPQPDWELEVSHHYGIEQFQEFGLAMITLVNRDYCKKFIVLLPGQEHPAQYHREKEEFFSVLAGELNVEMDGEVRTLAPGQSVVVPRGCVHRMWSDSGVVWEEISSTHLTSDSYYVDESITANRDRKTIVRLAALLHDRPVAAGSR